VINLANTIIAGIKERIANSAKINQSVGIIVPGNNYTDMLEALFSHMKSNTDDVWAYVAITKPFDTIKKTCTDLSNFKNIKFIDCISRAAGIATLEGECTYIESPTMLEKVSMEAMNMFQGIPEETNKYLVIDSLSAMMIYNDPETVTEFFYHLINKTRANDIHSISMVIEEEELDKYLSKIIYLNDKILKVRDSFI